MVAFFSAKVLFPGRFDTGLSGIVSGTVFVRMGLDILLVHFGNISKKVSAGVHRVVPDTPDLSPESGEIVLEFSELHVGFRLDLLEHHDALVADLFPVPFVLGHLVPDEIGAYVQGGRKHQGVERGDLPGSYEDVISDLVADYYLPVAVVDDAPGGVDDIVDHRVVRCVDLVLVFDDLDIEQLAEQDGGDHHQSDQHDAAPVVTFCRHS